MFLELRCYCFLRSLLFFLCHCQFQALKTKQMESHNLNHKIKVHIDPHCGIHICTFAYSLNLTCNPRVSAPSPSVVTQTCTEWDNMWGAWCAHSQPRSYKAMFCLLIAALTINVLFCGLYMATFFMLFLVCVVIPLFKIVPKCCAV